MILSGQAGGYKGSEQNSFLYFISSKCNHKFYLNTKLGDFLRKSACLDNSKIGCSRLESKHVYDYSNDMECFYVNLNRD
jgi:hypothetical protein